MVQQKSKRQSWVDFARGIAIILVVYRHVFDSLRNTDGLDTSNYMYLFHLNTMFYSFRMPLFFIVSGIFLSSSFAKRGLKRYVLNKGYTILYPYLVWGGVQIAIQIIFGKYTNGDRSLIDFLKLIIHPREEGQFWYLNALFGVSVLYVILKYTVKLKYVHQVIIGVAMFYGASLLNRNAVNLGFLNDIFAFYIYIVIGDGISRFVRNPENLKFLQSYKLLLLLFIPFLITQYTFLYLNYHHPEVGGYRYIEYYLPSLLLVIILIGCSFTLALSFILQKFESPGWLRQLGSYSLYIYVAHVVFASGTRIFLMNVFNVSNVLVLFFVGLAAGLFFPVVFYKIVRHFGMEWIFKLDENKMSWSKEKKEISSLEKRSMEIKSEPINM